MDETPGEPKDSSAREYETAGYVLGGKAELHIGDQSILLEEGDSWVVNRGVAHCYRIIEPFTAVEATDKP